MCGIFGIISRKNVPFEELKSLALSSERRGQDSSGLMHLHEDRYIVTKANFRLKELINSHENLSSNFVMGHSRLVTNGLSDNQPVIYNDISVIHNGIIVNHEELWRDLGLSKKLDIDTEIIAAVVHKHLSQGLPFEEVGENLLSLLKGTFSCAILVPQLGKLLLISNNGSLFFASSKETSYFASEKFFLRSIGQTNITQIRNNFKILDITKSSESFLINEKLVRQENYILPFSEDKILEKKLVFQQPNLRRCSKCILPETMPYITYDENGVCNYCHNYKIRNEPKPIEQLNSLLERYRRVDTDDCIIPFSGGRDSCYALHLAINELSLKPITYTYDWGMVTDLGRRNISRMCSELGVENIIIAADIKKKRHNIRRNLSAWLKNPNLGMLSILTAGDKHFFKHVDTVKRETGLSLNIWGINPLEITHFKAGFLGVPPDFAETRVYNSKWGKQINYQLLRLKAMIASPGYFNTSLVDTLSGEYYRTFAKKEDYYHAFDYWKWDENELDTLLINEYGWELATDTTTTWRIGDGTAAFYNYVYYTVAGFTEHDTFRSNQIREGDISRERALELANSENRPRFENIKWYLDSVGIDYEPAIEAVNSIRRLH
jgi:glucosamine--fructose-6-phosphate aminotransferase (isomerizing)